MPTSLEQLRGLPPSSSGPIDPMRRRNLTTPAPTTPVPTDAQPTGMTYTTIGKNPSSGTVPGPTGGAVQTTAPTTKPLTSLAKPPAPVSPTPGAPGTAPITGASSAYPTTGMAGPYQASTNSSAPNTSASYTANVNQNELMSNQLNDLISSNSLYMRNARQRGLEAAASRGLLNSSIASGSSMRSALEAAAPIAAFDASRYGSVADQNNAFRFGEAAAQNQMYRTDWMDSQSQARGFQYSDALANNQAVRQNWLDAESSSRNAQFQDALAENQARRQDWLASQDFNRAFNGNLAMMPIASSADFLSNLMNAAINDPTVFTPDVISGYQNFFTGAFNNVISQYLGGGG